MGEATKAFQETQREFVDACRHNTGHVDRLRVVRDALGVCAALELIEEVARLEAENRRLREALKPFAYSVADDGVVRGRPLDDDFRDARAVLAWIELEGDDE